MSPEGKPIKRRRLLMGAAGVAAGGAAAFAGYQLGQDADDEPAPPEGASAATDPAQTVVPFAGRHQAGITTAAQENLHFASFDVTTEDRRDLQDLMRTWTDAGLRMATGAAAGRPAFTDFAPPVDTGEALDLPPSALTMTFGFGPSLFDDRFGLAKQRPAALRQLPPLPGDEIDPERSGGDICIQACANDPQVAFHAVRNLARLGRGVVVMKWSQLGFGRTSTTRRTQSTPRNLMGFKDGTNNIRAEDLKLLAEHVWIGPGESPEWMRGGTFMVTRRIRMLIEVWDRASLKDQEDTIGRRKDSGAPYGGTEERDPVKPRKLPVGAHVKLAIPEANDGQRLLRRGYSFTDGMDADLGQLDAGLFFIAFQRDPMRQFVPIQRQLGSSDALNEYIKHTSSAVFAVPPGIEAGEYIAQGLFEAT